MKGKDAEQILLHILAVFGLLFLVWMFVNWFIF